MPGLELIGLGVLVIIVALVLLIVMARTLRVARPDEALIITGRAGARPARVVIGSRAFVVPIRNRGYTISLASRSVKVQVEGISRNGIKLFLEGVAQVKIGGDEANVRLAAQRFLHQQDQIETYTQDILAGSLRAVVGTLSVEQIVHERAALAQSVQDVALDSLNNQGLIIDTLQISSVEDDSNYLSNLGRPDSARVEKLAAIAEAEARQESAEKNAIADEGIAVAEQQLAIRRAEIKEETDARQAAADASGPLAQAQQREQITIREEQVAIRQAELKEKQLDTEVRRPADAARYRAEQEAAAELARRQADAEAHRADGLAEAATIQASGRAEAEAIEAKAEAYAKFNQAAIVDRLADVLPKIARELSQPYANIDDLTVISTDGASKLSQSVANNLNETVTLVERMTGVDLRQLVGSVPEKSPSRDSDGVVPGEAADSSADSEGSDDAEDESGGDSPGDADRPDDLTTTKLFDPPTPPQRPALPTTPQPPAPASTPEPPQPPRSQPPHSQPPQSQRSAGSARLESDRPESSTEPDLPAPPRRRREAPRRPDPAERRRPPRPDRRRSRGDAAGNPDPGEESPGERGDRGQSGNRPGFGPQDPDRPILPTFGEPPASGRPQFPPPFPPPAGPRSRPSAGRPGPEDDS